jgi:hypothetical protein
MKVIPAARGTCLLQITGQRDYCKIPVFSWTVGASNDLQPLTVEPFDRTTILYPCGRVFDQETQTAFDNDLEWWAEVFS